MVYVPHKKSGRGAHRDVGAATGWWSWFRRWCLWVAGCSGGQRRLRGGPASRRDEGVGGAYGRPGPWHVERWLTEEGVDDGDLANSSFPGGRHRRRSG
jgi:hypothetical protein